MSSSPRQLESQLIDRIVREVLAALNVKSNGDLSADSPRQANFTAATNEGDATSARGTTDTTRIDVEETGVASQARRSTLTLTERLITLETLRGQAIGVSRGAGGGTTSASQGIQRIVVPARAVVTPAVIDELRDRKIELLRCTEVATSNKPRQTNWEWLVDSSPASQSMADDLRQRWGDLAFPTHRSAVPHTLGGEQRRLIITETPFETLFAWQRQGIRAALCRAAADVEEASGVFAAQVYLLDARGKLCADLVERLRELIMSSS